MKKFLVLAMVFAMSAVASANLTNIITHDNIDDFSADGVFTSSFGEGYFVANGVAKTGTAPYVEDFSYVALNDADYIDFIANDNKIALSITNENNHKWAFFLYAVKDGESYDTALTSNEITIWNYPNEPYAGSLSLDLVNGVKYSEVGIGIRSLPDIDGGSDGIKDDVLFSVSVPAPGAVLLAGLGTSVVGLIRRRTL